MAVPQLVPGYQFLLQRGDGGSPENFVYLSTVTSRGLDQAVGFDDAELTDEDNPGALPVRVSVPKAKSWSISFSGKTDAIRFQVLQNDMRAVTPRSYRLVINLSGAQGGGYFEGRAFPEGLKFDVGENGIMTFSGTLRGQGDFPAWTANP